MTSLRKMVGKITLRASSAPGGGTVGPPFFSCLLEMSHFMDSRPYTTAAVAQPGFCGSKQNPGFVGSRVGMRRAGGLRPVSVGGSSVESEVGPVQL